MKLDISRENLNVIERGVYYLGLSDYPRIEPWELKNIIDFIKYEHTYGRQVEIVCQDEDLLAAVNDAVSHPEKIEQAVPEEDGFVYHATDVDAAGKILSGGRLLSAERVYGKTAEALSFEKRDSPWNDPPDYFKYIMFCWGDHPVGDYVVLSENPPGEEDLASGNFNAGVRFYFRYEDILRHPGHILDGYHAVKVKDEILLADYMYACIAPEQYRSALDGSISPELASKVYFLPQKGLALDEWNETAFVFVSNL